jgi:hypothetical protein
MHPVSTSDLKSSYETKAARRPIARAVTITKAGARSKNAVFGLSSTSRDDVTLFFSSNDEGVTVIADPPPSPPLRARGVPSMPLPDPSKLASTTPKTSRVPKGKKAEAEAQQSRREVYAQALFDELNAFVFGGELPAVKLIWSKRLLTTAGRAKWHRSKAGVDTTEIELATKILDCDGQCLL